MRARSEGAGPARLLLVVDGVCAEELKVSETFWVIESLEAIPKN